VSRLVKRVSAAFSRFVHFSDQMQHLKLLRVHITQLAGGEMVEDHCVMGRASMPKPCFARGARLLLYTTQRRSDVVRLGHKMAHDGWLKFTQYKNANRNPISLEIPILAELQRIINATTPLGKDTYLVTEFSGVGMLVLLPSPSCQRPLRLLRGA
jgi:hypothetical protein